MSQVMDDWERALVLLGEVLECRRATPSHLVVCGGAALKAAAVVSRVTYDVDVLAERGGVDGEITSAWPLPDDLKEAVADVAGELGLVGPLDELPPEVWADLQDRSYGSRLRISFVGRSGQILFHAAVGRREARDLDDLKALAPAAGECRRALGWLRRSGLDESGEFRLKEILTLFGHGND